MIKTRSLEIRSHTEKFLDAAEHGRVFGLRVGLMVNRLPVDVRDSEGRTALMRTAKGGHLDAVKYLVEKGADIFAISNKGESAHYDALDHKGVLDYLDGQVALVARKMHEKGLAAASARRS